MPDSTSNETHFLGWDAPLLQRACQFLLQNHADSKCFDGNALIGVLPTLRSANRLAQMLREQCEEQGLEYVPPHFITVGELPEHLYASPRQAAIEFEQTLAWAGVPQSTPRDQLTALVPSPPKSSAGNSNSTGIGKDEEDSIEPWLELGSTLRRLQAELSTSGLSFGDVAEVCESDSEIARWKLLESMSQRYTKALEDVSLVDPDTARLDAIKNQVIQCDREIVLVGTSDMIDLLVAMLRACKTKVTSLIAAPDSQKNRFDEFGCVRTERWLQHQLPLSDDQLIPANDLSDVAVAASKCVTAYQSDTRSTAAGSVVVGATDASQVGPVEMELRGAGQPTHRQIGWTVAATSLGRLLGLVSRHAKWGTWQTLAALVRHSIVANQITHALKADNEREWLTQVDGLLSNHYPTTLKSNLTKVAQKNYPLAIAVKEYCDQWLRSFDQKPQPLSQWSEIAKDWIATFESAVTGDTPGSERTARAIRQSRQLLERFCHLNHQLDPIVSGSTAIEMIRGRLVDLRVVLDPKDDEIPIVGWLDLALDDSDAMVVMGLNHPYVPSATTSDPFLPGSLRTQLKMADNDRRYARDVYAMQLMLSTRKQTHFIVGKKAGDGSPTPPSRLIAAADKEDTSRRIRLLFEPSSGDSTFGSDVELNHRWHDGPTQTNLPIPSLAETSTKRPFAETVKPRNSKASGQLVSVMSVTAFRDYLMCPYRFYLRHVLKMKPLDDERSELAANQFGDLVHAAVEMFGESASKDEEDETRIKDALIEYLHQYAGDHYGEDASTSVKLQITQAERRLEAVAAAQAKRIAAGWKIHATEASVDEKSGAKIEVDGGSVGIRGRFDRIDHHPGTGQWAILDYKTHKHKPEKKHLKKVDGVETWIDLQLPLYRLMIPYLGIDADPNDVELGYFNVGDKDSETKINIATFTSPQLAEAEQLIYQCVSGVLAEDFEPAVDPPQYDDYGMILQTGAFPLSSETSAEAGATEVVS